MKSLQSAIRKDGFTLIELMIVIAIIGVLFTLVSPQLSKARLKSRLTQQAHHAKSIVEAIVAKESSSRFSKGWPRSGEDHTTSSTEYLIALVEGGFLDVDYAFFAGPNMRPALDKADFEANGAECNAWSIMLNYNDASAGNLPAVFMSSYSYGGNSFSDSNIPVGLKGFAFATKNGEAMVVGQSDMENSAAFDSIFNREKLGEVSGLGVMEP